MDASGTAVDLLTLTWISIVTSQAAPVKMKATPRSAITTRFVVVMAC